MRPVTSPPPPKVIQRVERGLIELNPLFPRLTEPNLPAVRQAVEGLHSGLVMVVRWTMPTEGHYDELIHGTLLRSFQCFQALRTRRTWPAAMLLVKNWSEEMVSRHKLQVLAIDREAERSWNDFHEGIEEIWEDWLVQERPVDTSVSTDGEWMLLYNQVVGESIAHALVDGRTRAALRALLTRLDFSQDDVGRMFAVSGETVRRWERGQTRIPTDRKAEILAAEGALNRLLEVFQPERLPVVIRRRVPLFDGESALDYMHRGRIAEVADRYESALLYQG